jgi:hypothetical protein
MDGWVWAVIIAAAVILIVAALWAMSQNRRRTRVLSGFGPEYDRAVEHHGDRRTAERDLMDRARRHDRLELKPLPVEARVRYRQEWQGIQARFVDAPEETIGAADRLLDRVMRDRGYPVDDPAVTDAGAAPGDRVPDKIDLVSVDHPDLMADYREARAVQHRNAQRLASTDELRQAILRYRSLFDALLRDGSDDLAERPAAGRDGLSPGIAR